MPLASGLLTGKYDESTTFPADDHRNFNRHGEAFDVGETFSGVPFEVGVAAAREVAEIAGDASDRARSRCAGSSTSPASPRSSRARATSSRCAATWPRADLPPLTTGQLADLERVYDERIRAHVHDRW